MAARLKKLRLDEVSLVDRGANQHAHVTLFKRDDMGEFDKFLAPGFEKDLNGVARFAALLQEIQYLAQGAEYESEMEGDESPVPDAIKSWLRDGTKAFRQMADEEVRELIAAVKKRNFSAGERKTDAKSGAAMADGCLTGETLVVTKDGSKPIASLVGRDVDLLTSDGRNVGWWSSATVASHGRKPVRSITFVAGETSVTVKASLGHRWILESGEQITTRELKEGMVIPFVLLPDSVPAIFGGEVAEHANAHATSNHQSLVGATNGSDNDNVVRGRASMRPVREVSPRNGLSPQRGRQVRRPLSEQNLQRLPQGKVRGTLQRNSVFASVAQVYGRGEDLLEMCANETFDRVHVAEGRGAISQGLQSLCDDQGPGAFRKEPRTYSQTVAGEETSDIRHYASRLREDADGSEWRMRSVWEARGERALEPVGCGSLSQDFGGSRSSLSSVQFGAWVGGSNDAEEDFGIYRWIVRHVGATQEAQNVYCATVPETGAFVLGGGLLTGNSFPIEDAGDLANAMRLAGHAKDPAAARRHIKARAKALGLESHLSGAYAKAVIEQADRAVAKALEGGAAFAQTVTDYQDYLDGVLPAEIVKAHRAASSGSNAQGDATMTPEEIAANELAKKGPPKISFKDEAEGDELKDEDSKGKKPKKNPDDKDQKYTDPKGDKADKRADDDLAKRLDDAVAKAAAQDVIIKAMQEERDIVAFGKRAVTLGLDEVHGEVLRKAYAGDKAAIVQLEALLKGLTEQVRTGKVFAEFGAVGAGVPATAAAEMDAVVKDVAKRDGLTYAKAFDKVYTDRDHADLKKRYDAETSPLAKRRA